MKVIELKNVSFKYDEEYVVKNVSFSIEKGSYTTIIGHNGSGKSTIAKLIMGLLEKEKGQIFVDGLELTLENLYNIREKIGIVFQNPDNQFIGSTVRDDIAFGLENHCIPHEQMDPLILKFAEKVGMLNYLDSEPTKLSGGQKQRVAIAGVLAMYFNVIIFDEATSMLDPQGKKEINELIEEIHREKNITIVSITHDIEEAVKSDYVIVMDKGKVAMEGKPEEILLREKELIQMQLDIPFTLKLKNELKKQGVNVETNIKMEGMVDALCQLNLNK